MDPLVYNIEATDTLGFVPSSLVIGHSSTRKQKLVIRSSRGPFLCEEVGEGRFEVDVDDDEVEIELDTLGAANLTLIDSMLPFCQLTIELTGERIEEVRGDERGELRAMRGIFWYG